jgi:hypothetical protein
MKLGRPLLAGCLLLAVCFSALDVMATTLTIDPPAPTNLTPVTIAVTSNCPTHGAITQNGFVFDIESNYNCILLPLITTEYEVGLLPPGTYTVREVDVDNPSSTLVIGTFVVAAATTPIPALDFRGLAALAFALTLVAFVALRRST